MLDYAAGTLADGPALAVALHLAFDPAARHVANGLAALGGILIESENAADVDTLALETVLGRLDGVSVDPLPKSPPPHPDFDWAPAALRPYLGPVTRWKRRLGGFEEIELDLRDDVHRVSLLRLEPGNGLPMHRHMGNEYTVVLLGGYTDRTGNYVVGDFAMGPGVEEHQPIADPGECCIALIVEEKPIVLTGRWGRWLNPLVRRGWL